MRKIYITESQVKKLKKALAAQDQVGGKVNAGVMDAVCGAAMCEDVDGQHIETYYRGYDPKYGVYGAYTPYMLWLTDDLDYAKVYGTAVMEYQIDESKCHGSVYDLPEDVDYYDGPSEELAKELLKDGINSYGFYANEDSSYCMCIWDLEEGSGHPILSSKPLQVNEEEIPDKYQLGYDVPGDANSYAHVIKEDPDRLRDFDNTYYEDKDSIAFMGVYGDDNIHRIYVADEGGISHKKMINKLVADGTLGEEFKTLDVQNVSDDIRSGRWWQNNNVISFWDTPIPKKFRFIITDVVNAISKKYDINLNTLLIECWGEGDNCFPMVSYIPYRWFFNGTLDMFKDLIRRVSVENEKYVRMELKDDRVFFVNYVGNEFLTWEQYQDKLRQSYGMVNEKTVKNDKGGKVPEKCDKCGGDVVLQIHGEPVYVCKKCGKYFGTMPFPETLKENRAWCEAFDYKPYLKSITKFLEEQGLEISPWPKVIVHDTEQEGLYIRTGFYDPGKKEVHLFVKDRHPKDVLRSFVHEMIHHNQNVTGVIDNNGYKGDTLDGDDELQKLESDAYLRGNILFRKWTEECRPEIPGAKKPLNESVEHNILTLYRGYNKDLGIQKTNLLWLTTSLRYAASYGNSVVEYKIDESQLNIFDGWDLENPYDGLTANEEKTLKKEGYNTYAFEAGNDAETYVLFDQALIDSLHPRVMEIPEVKEKLGLLNESIQDIYNMQEDWDEFGVSSLLSEFFRDKKRGITKKQWDLIPAQQYQNLLTRYMQDPITARIPDNVVYNWFEKVVKNAFDIEYITELAGHSQWFPADEVQEEFDAWVGEKYQITDYMSGYEALEAEGFYEWCSLPDGSDGWSDYGLEPIFKELSYYKPNMPAGDILILINRVLHIGHCRGDLASAFIEGGSQSCSAISGIIREGVEESLTPDEVDLSSFEIKKELNPEFWENGKLKKEIRFKLLDIADDFVDSLDVSWANPKDIIITGSIANYNWNREHSDIDLHVLMDFNDVDKKTDFVKEYFDVQRKLWNDKHDIKIHGYKVEVYVQDVKEPHASSGVYSLDKNDWLVKPSKDNFSMDDFDDDEVKKTVSHYTEEIDKLYDQARSGFGAEDILKRSRELAKEIKELRTKGFENGGEYNTGNIIFKSLRRNGYLGKLLSLKDKIYDELKSLTQ